jgi:hypothetical protein
VTVSTAAVTETPRSAPSGVRRIRVLRSQEELDEVRFAWPALGLRTIDTDIDYMRTVAESRAPVIRPHVVLLEEDGEPRAALVGRLEDNVLPARFGYATLWRPRLRCITVLHGGAAGTADEVRELFAALLGALSEGEAQALVVHRVEVGSPLHREASTQPRAACRPRFQAVTRHWSADLPGTFDDFQRSLPKSLRGNARRDGRKLVEALGDRMEIRRLSEPAELDRILADLEEIASKTYQRGLGAGFNAAADAELVKCALDNGWLNAWVMYIDGAPCAFELGHVYGDTFFSDAKGFDPAHRKHNVGTFLQMRMFEDLCEDPRVTAVDFGFGDADYKRRCATRGWDETDLVVYAPAPRPVAVGAVRHAVTGLDLAARRFAGKERIARVKRRWRDLRTPG